MTDDNRPVKVSVSRGDAETVSQQLNQWTLGSSLKLCHRVVIAFTENRSELLRELALFADECGIEVPNNDNTGTNSASAGSREFQYLKRCFDREPCQNKVVELPFMSLVTDFKAAFVLVKITVSSEGNQNVKMDFSYIEMSLGQPLTDGDEQYNSTEEVNEEGYDLGYVPKHSPARLDRAMSRIPENDKQNYFRYEAIKRLHLEGVYDC